MTIQFDITTGKVIDVDKPTVEMIETALADLPTGIGVWERPRIAPPGFMDFCAGQTIFPIYNSAGEIISSVFYLTKGDLKLGIEVPANLTNGSLATAIAKGIWELEAAWASRQ